MDCLSASQPVMGRIVSPRTVENDGQYSKGLGAADDRPTVFTIHDVVIFLPGLPPKQLFHIARRNAVPSKMSYVGEVPIETQGSRASELLSYIFCQYSLPKISSVQIFPPFIRRSRWMVMEQQDERIAAAVDQEQSRLRSFIRRRVPDPGEVEDRARLKAASHRIIRWRRCDGW